MFRRIFGKLVIMVFIMEAGWLLVVYFQKNGRLLDFIKGIEMDSWTAIGTIFLGFMALGTLFYDRYKNRKAKVSMKINLVPPDSHQIELTKPNGEAVSKCIYVRIRVEHLKGNPAEDVEVMVSNFWSIDENNNKEVRKSFLPMNLMWSHYGVKELRVPNGLFRHCDFGSFRPKFTNNTHTVLRLDTVVQPNRVSNGEVPNVIEPGKYEFELMLSGRNSNVIKKRWMLEFDENWSDIESEMLENHISIKERTWFNFLLKFSR